MSNEEKALTRADLAEAIYRKNWLSFSESTKLVDVVLEEFFSMYRRK